jgi:hypothetical protein
VPRLLIDDLQRANDNENLRRIVVTSDEMWVDSYDVETKQQSSHWQCPASPRPQESMMDVLMSESSAAFFLSSRHCAL